MKVSDLEAIRIKLASPEQIREWSHGEVKKPETLNYRTQKPEKEGLFCEKIFGPTKNYECYCGKYRGVRFKGVVCDRCGVEVTTSEVRRERMGHIELAAPCSHIWFLRGIPSRIGLALDVPREKIERVIYFVAYIVEEVDEKAKSDLWEEARQEFQTKKKEINGSNISNSQKERQLKELEQNFNKTKQELSSIVPWAIISEVEYRNLSFKYGEAFSAGTGSEAVLRVYDKIDVKKEIETLRGELKDAPSNKKKKIVRRLKFLEGMDEANLDIKWMFLSALPVLPPELRPMVQLDGGRYASSDFNDLYRRVINRNNRLRHLIEISAPETIIRNEKRMLQEAVDSLLDSEMKKAPTTTSASTEGKRALKSLSDSLKGKQGRFRKNLLGKRVDYSGRSVIASGPELRFNQCGIPKVMALELFRPYIIKKLLDKELAFHIKGASRLIDDKTPEVFTALEEVVRDRPVLLNRAPTLHRLGVQAFEPVLIEGQAIKIHPLVCKAYNADFDGDQMGVYLPLSKDAQKEAKGRMLSSNNLLKPATGKPIVAPTIDVILGIYWLTTLDPEFEGIPKTFLDFSEVISAYHMDKLSVRTPVKVYEASQKEGKETQVWETTCGRILFNQCFPESFPFVNGQVDSGKLKKSVERLTRYYSNDQATQALDKIKDLGFEYATLSGTTVGMNDFRVPEDKSEIIQEKRKEIDNVENQFNKGFLSGEEKGNKVIELWQEAKNRIEEKVVKSLTAKNPVSLIVNSGAKGSWAQPSQVCGMKGLVASPSGEVIQLPITSCFKEGFDVLEFFISSHGARKGTVDTALRTSASGYLTRRLADVAHELIVSEEDCGDKNGRVVYRKDADEIGQDFKHKIVGRVTLEDIADPKTKEVIVKAGDVINWEKAEEIEESSISEVRVRTPLSCKSSRGVCRKCYGWEMGKNKMIELGSAAGIIAAQSIGEPGTQLTMRTFHLGGVAGGGDITMGLPRVEEIFELRKLKSSEGVISMSDGIVKEINQKKNKIVISPTSGSKKSKKADEQEYQIPENIQLLVNKGDKVSSGQSLTSGPLDIKRLYNVAGAPETQRYITKEIQRVYVGEGIDIHDKHLETIVRQMFSRMRVVEPGDGPWSLGEIISRGEFAEVQEKLKKENRSLAQAETVLLGISRASLTSDSFLSAASFQETSRVLIDSAVQGKEDYLRGLKENVIIGRLIPAGTGFDR